MSEGGTWAVVLAGGTGTRLWPASRPERPKQLLPLGIGGRPLVAGAVDRAIRVAGRERVRLLARRDLLELLRAALPRLADENFLAEPAARGTGPALTWAAHRIAREDPDAVMLSLHADHRIGPDEAFDRTARRTLHSVREQERLFCIGVRPDRPETGYGYVHLGEPLGEDVYEVQEFVEKPGRHWARRYVDSGEYLWNTGLFAWRARDFLQVARDRAPELSTGLDRLDGGDVEGFFREVTPVSVDVAVMERARRVGAVEAGFDWDDLGVWTAVARALRPDEEGNASMGPAELVEGARNVVWSEDGRVVLFGVDDLVVVRSGGTTLVTDREHAPRLKQLLGVLEERGGAGGIVSDDRDAAEDADGDGGDEPGGGADSS